MTMTLREAIGIKEQYLRDNQPYDLEELEEADKLLIQAGKAMICGREGLRTEFHTPLQGETEE